MPAVKIVVFKGGPIRLPCDLSIWTATEINLTMGENLMFHFAPPRGGALKQLVAKWVHLLCKSHFQDAPPQWLSSDFQGNCGAGIGIVTAGNIKQKQAVRLMTEL
jgi:hypothetical protein